MDQYQSEREIESVVRGFESCETGKDQFKHRHHLVVAVWYLQTLSREAAIERMRASLLRFLDHHGIDKGKYSETITVFWIDRIADKLNELGPDVSLVDRCNTILNAHFQPETIGGSTR
jgi:hypothetical protein